MNGFYLPHKLGQKIVDNFIPHNNNLILINVIIILSGLYVQTFLCNVIDIQDNTPSWMTPKIF